jgi:hypothetical protein
MMLEGTRRRKILLLLVTVSAFILPAAFRDSPAGLGKPTLLLNRLASGPLKTKARAVTQAEP